MMTTVLQFDQVDDATIPRIGRKAANLVKMKEVGLPVPDGYCILDDAHAHYIENGTLPDRLVQEIVRAKNILGGKIAIRSSANCEDGATLSMAGVFRSQYVLRDEDIQTAVEQIYEQARSEEVDQFMAIHGKSSKDVKMGLVIQKLIEPEIAGVIYTGVNGDKLFVQYIEGFGASLVDGKNQGSAVLADRNNIIVESTGFETIPLPASAVQQIAKHSRTIENLFLGMPQDIEFAYKDGTVFILQARDLTADLGRVDLRETPAYTLEATKHKLRQLVADEKLKLEIPTAIFSDANYSELLPKPTEMDIGIHMYVWGGSDGIPGAKQLGHAAMGYLVGDEANPIISYIGGRAYFSIARYAGLYYIGFPETKEEYFATLVREYLEAVQKDPKKGAYPQMGLFLQDPSFEDLQTRFGDRAIEYFKVYQEFAARMRDLADNYLSEFHTKKRSENLSFVEKMQSVELHNLTNEQLVNHVTEVLEHIRTKSYIDFVKGARLGFYYAQRLQNLLRAKLGIGKDESQELYSRLIKGLDGSAITDANIAISQTVSEEEALRMAQELIGHYSTGEMLEIRHKPMRDRPDRLLAYVRGIRQTGQYKADFEKQRQARMAAQQAILASVPIADREELAQAMQAAQIYMAIRETAKYDFTKEYLLVRDTLELLGERTGLQGGDIYHLYPRELSQVVSDPKAMLHIIRSRKQSFSNYAELDMPPVIQESDIDILSLLENDNAAFIEAKGNFLAEGPAVTGVIVNSDDFKDFGQVNEIIQYYRQQGVPVILAATQINLSHDPLIGQAAGLVIKNAGLVAHGAQRARELGKGAIGGINTKSLLTGTKVSFDPETRTIKKIYGGE